VNVAIAGLGQLGYYLIEAEVSEIVDRAAQGAVVGLLGGGLLGLSTPDPWSRSLAASVGTIAGSWADSTAEQVVARRHPAGSRASVRPRPSPPPAREPPGGAPQPPHLRPTIPRFP
jgi:hypothetical protein